MSKNLRSRSLPSQRINTTIKALINHQPTSTNQNCTFHNTVAIGQDDRMTTTPIQGRLTNRSAPLSVPQARRHAGRELGHLGDVSEDLRELLFSPSSS